MKCQSDGIPFSLEYISIGERKIRFLNSISLSFNGENNLLAIFHSPSFFIYHTMLEDKKHWAKVNRRAQTMLILAGLRRVIEPHVNLEFSRIITVSYTHLRAHE